LVALTSDHGEELYDHDFYFFHSGSTHDAALRVPLVLRLPGRLPAGRCIDRPVVNIDIAPTLSELLGVARRLAFEGKSLAGDMLGSVGEGAEEQAALSELEREIHSLRTSRWRFIYNPSGYEPADVEALLPHCIDQDALLRDAQPRSHSAEIDPLPRSPAPRKPPRG
jgi:arylsulfatase A-like enzyme